MTSLQAWLTDAANALNLTIDEIPADLRTELLALAPAVRTLGGEAAPTLTGYLLGLAVDRGTPPRVAIDALRELATARQDQSTDAPPVADQPRPQVPGGDTAVPLAREHRPDQPDQPVLPDQPVPPDQPVRPDRSSTA